MVTAFHPNTQRISVFSHLRQWVLPGLVLTIATTLVSCASQTNTESSQVDIKTKVVKVGYQISSTLIKTEGVLEKRLAPLRIKVEWVEFAAGLPLTEALNVGSIDIGAVGDTPPIFGQAAGADLVYIATTVPNGAGSAILVQEGSPIQRIADLKDQRVALQKGSSSHYFLLQVLERAKLSEKDIDFVFLPPADARAAFAQGAVDAWVIWDPYYALAERALDVRVIETRTNYVTQGSFYLASRSFVEENPDAIRIILDEIQKLNEWADANPQKVAAILSAELGVDQATLEIVENRRRNSFRPIDKNIIQEQQRIADTFHRLGFIPQKIDVRDAMLTPEEYAKITPEIISGN